MTLQASGCIAKASASCAKQGVEFWSYGEIQEASTGINLLYKSMNSNIMAEYCSAHETYLILPDEEYDATTGTVKEAGQYTYTVVPTPEDDSLDLPSNPFESDLEELGDHPF
ncbi:hypothetical protein [Ktedonobacter racemifer]|uniref:Uncharacterized protein n=1 Tax=Ktedonobacter racemifer DSM 44963 TaxID=485913 RepID=D6U1Q6_KTERA|nr:hypothetical protein [Ktedonobacter racemifer]EFH82700.1 hypothetical protein Krac_3538 [Ktedonobacter racemifer DSM 44963]